jgi:hypothetical protein
VQFEDDEPAHQISGFVAYFGDQRLAALAIHRVHDACGLHQSQYRLPGNLLGILIQCAGVVH